YTAVLRQRALNAPTPPLASFSRGTGVRIFVAYPVIDGERVWGVVYLSRTPNNILKHMYASRDRFVVLGLAIVLVTMALAWITSRTIGQPVDALAEQARRLARGEPDALTVLPHYGTREAAILGQSFIDMATALEARSVYLRDFASHVSHEFKTPLTAIRGAAELLGEHVDTMPAAERRRFLENIVADTNRLQALVTGLLALARADNAEPEASRIALVAALDQVRQSAGPDDVTVSVEGPGDAAARISADSLSVIARNLIANAAEAGATLITFSVAPDRGGWLIRVADNGRGISDGNRGRIFEPFFTTRRDTGGTGLGLRIIQSVLRAHYGSIALAATGPSGTTFEIWLPAASGN
ncbi:MAG: HAMP domain-containing protein, partial [Hyphomicrobiaceae bacterium]|nr:HAMP domain-containing protein [Hyphomicrobiaceae bacterium]